jgi:hypothetical protein
MVAGLAALIADELRDAGLILRWYCVSLALGYNWKYTRRLHPVKKRFYTSTQCCAAM